MLLLHGIGGELCVWEPVLGALESSYDAIAVDLPGFGHSPPLPCQLSPTPAALARALIRFLDELAIGRAHVVGNSLGGWLALQVAALGRALSVTALCPAGLWPAPRVAKRAVVRGRAHRAVKRLSPALPVLLASRRVRRLVLAPFVADPDKVPYRATVRMLRSYGRATAYDATATAMRQSHFAAGTEVGVPVTVAFGERDRLIRPAPSRIRDARTVMLPGCGHIPMWDAPQLVAGVIRETAESAVAAPVDRSFTAT